MDALRTKRSRGKKPSLLLSHRENGNQQRLSVNPTGGQNLSICPSYPEPARKVDEKEGTGEGTHNRKTSFWTK